ncbi:hypothetical protein BGZ60DRAFT_422797 [Tricladium varicosporioides]|nr:hypothetical protein BGZ60DRAFT_422797 [Hymenoscyphus varicosporioides]
MSYFKCRYWRKNMRVTKKKSGRSFAWVVESNQLIDTIKILYKGDLVDSSLWGLKGLSWIGEVVFRKNDEKRVNRKANLVESARRYW